MKLWYGCDYGKSYSDIFEKSRQCGLQKEDVPLWMMLTRFSKYPPMRRWFPGTWIAENIYWCIWSSQRGSKVYFHILFGRAWSLALHKQKGFLLKALHTYENKWDELLLCSPGYPWFCGPPASSSGELGLQVCILCLEVRWFPKEWW